MERKSEILPAMQASGIPEKDVEIAYHIMVCAGEGASCIHEIVERYWLARSELIKMVQRWRGWFAAHTNIRGDGWKLAIYD